MIIVLYRRIQSILMKNQMGISKHFYFSVWSWTDDQTVDQEVDRAIDRHVRLCTGALWSTDAMID